MEAHNIVKLALDYAAYFQVANMQDPDEIQGASELFPYYCREKFTTCCVWHLAIQFLHH